MAHFIALSANSSKVVHIFETFSRLGLFLMILFPVLAFTQSGFIFKYSTPNDETPSCILETNDGGFIVCGPIGTYPDSYHTLLIRLNKYGDSIKTKIIEYPIGFSFISELVKLDNGTYMGVGQKTLSSGEEKIWLITLSDSLDILNDTSYSCGLGTIYKLRGLRDHSGRVVIYGTSTVTDSLYDPPHLFILLATQQSDSLDFKYFHAGTSQMVFSMLEKYDTTGYFMFILGHYQTFTQTFSQILGLNYQLQVTTTDSIPEGLIMYVGSNNFQNGELFITGQKSYWGSNPRTDKLGILKLNSSMQLISDYFLGPDDTISYPGYISNIGINQDNKIFYGGATNQSINTLFPSEPSNIMLGCFDTSLNVIWQKYHGGDQYYGVWTVNTTTDGGCIIGASSFNYQVQSSERDIYILKVDSNGIITGINTNPPSKEQETRIYPNPGTDLINVETNLNHSMFYFYDLTGREIYNQALVSGSNPLHVQKLKPGLYIYKILQNSEVKEFGKWIKE